MSNLGNRSLLEAIAFPIAIENIMRGRLRGYYFNTFLLLAEQCARTLQHARWVAASLPATRELSPGAAGTVALPWVQAAPALPQLQPRAQNRAPLMLVAAASPSPQPMLRAVPASSSPAARSSQSACLPAPTQTRGEVSVVKNTEDWHAFCMRIEISFSRRNLGQSK